MTSIAPVLSIVATAYGLAAGASSLLQARQMLQRGSAGDVSMGFLGSYVGGYLIWLLYGVSIGSVPLIVVDAVGAGCGLTTLAIAVRLTPKSPARALIAWAPRLHDELAVLLKHLAVDRDPPAAPQVADHVPVDRALVDPARLGVTSPDREVDRAA